MSHLPILPILIPLFAASIARVMEQGSWWIRSGERAIIADVDP